MHAARDEHLSAVALVARAAPMSTVPFLAMRISERCSWLHQVRQSLCLVLLGILLDSVEKELPKTMIGTYNRRIFHFLRFDSSIGMLVRFS